MNELEREFCAFYRIDERRITNKECLLLIEILLDHFGKITFEYVTDKFLKCVYLSQIESEEDGDEAFIGKGDNIKDVILSQCLREEAICSIRFSEEVHKRFIKFPQRMREAFNIIFGE